MHLAAQNDAFVWCSGPGVVADLRKSLTDGMQTDFVVARDGRGGWQRGVALQVGEGARVEIDESRFCARRTEVDGKELQGITTSVASPRNSLPDSCVSSASADTRIPKRCCPLPESSNRQSRMATSWAAP